MTLAQLLKVFMPGTYAPMEVDRRDGVAADLRDLCVFAVQILTGEADPRRTRAWERASDELIATWSGAPPSPRLALRLTVEEAGATTIADTVVNFMPDLNRVYSAGTQSGCPAVVVGDLDRDGVSRLAMTTLDGRIHLFGPDGASRPGWPLPFPQLEIDADASGDVPAGMPRSLETRMPTAMKGAALCIVALWRARSGTRHRLEASTATTFADPA